MTNDDKIRVIKQSYQQYNINRVIKIFYWQYNIKRKAEKISALSEKIVI